MAFNPVAASQMLDWSTIHMQYMRYLMSNILVHGAIFAFMRNGSPNHGVLVVDIGIKIDEAMGIEKIFSLIIVVIVLPDVR